ncbi:hypothetical protein [Lacimicrobium sp. SS2-24]|uniref:hypothetical protein n=1 Tax=Lacimicrobium sp. SS2-24 TaxID=2005569 RepID=UPI000B4BCE21|nr:hypothetical protein [Lacimicrobium sp. SS2-24]
MEINAINAKLNIDFGKSEPVGSPPTDKPNAFGIGEANKPQVELSPQAKILQQTEQRQQERQQSLAARPSEDNDETSAELNNDFVRVSSSLGESAQANNLNSEKAAELYRSIEKML